MRADDSQRAVIRQPDANARLFSWYPWATARRTNIGSEPVSALCGYLAPRRHSYWRNNTGAFKAAHGGFYRFGTPGSPDIMLIKEGKFVGIEAEAGSGRLSPAQKEFQRLCEEHGDEYSVAHSIDDLQKAGL